MSNWSDEETNSPLRADDHDFYKVEKYQTSAADQADYPAADSRAGAVAGGVIRAWRSKTTPTEAT
jgi:hypothetical protein